MKQHQQAYVHQLSSQHVNTTGNQMYVSCIKETGNCIALTRRHSPLLAECEQHLGQFSGSLLKVKLPLAKCTLHLYNIYVDMIVKGFTKLSGLHETWPSSDKQMYRIFIPT